MNNNEFYIFIPSSNLTEILLKVKDRNLKYFLVDMDFLINIIWHACSTFYIFPPNFTNFSPFFFINLSVE